MKRGPDYDDMEPRHKHSRVSFDYVFKILGHHTFVGAILGKGGAMINTLHQETGCEILAARKTDLFTDTTFRVVHVSADSREKLQNGVFQIANLIPQLAETATNDAVRQDCLGRNPGEFRINFVIPKNLCGAIIGNKGDVIKETRQRTGCRFNVSHEAHNYGPIPENVCEVVGPMEGIQDILAGVMDALDADKHQQWYSRWASYKGVDGDDPKRRRQHTRDDQRSQDGGRRDRNERQRSSNHYESHSHHDSKQQQQQQHDRRDNDGDRHQSRGNRNDGGRRPKKPESTSNLRAEVERIEPVDADMDVETSTRVPMNLAGCLIGTRGAEIKKLKEMSGANVIVAEMSQDPEREVTIKGTPLQVCTAMLMIWNRLHEKSQQQSERSVNPAEEAIKAQMRDLKQQLRSVQQHTRH
eukprot:GEMP01047197.1.p1 GENE.GEMP01047197.1~~GEMP01047197.1.p1  ORF type:complete len:412 (+),score=90.32 GEMP01047197.1:73-1308(+)